MTNKKALFNSKNPPRESVSTRVSPRLKQLLIDGAAAHGLLLAPWIERVLWASEEVQQALLQNASPSDLPVPVRRYTLDEITLAHLTLLARSTNYLEEIARLVDLCRRERWVLDEMRLAESLHAVKDQLARLRPLHLARKSTGSMTESAGETAS